MYPLDVAHLSVGDLCEHWARAMTERVSARDLIGELWQRFWRGELSIGRGADRDPYEPREVLVILTDGQRLDSDFEGCARIDAIELPLMFVEAMPPTSTEHENGSVTVDLTRYIVLPADPTTWTDDHLRNAYGTLADVGLWAYPHLAIPVLLDAVVFKDDFETLCRTKGWPLPSFWFATREHASPRKVAKADAVHAARRWLRSMGSAPKPEPKAALRAQALDRFPGLSRRQFDQVWADEVPESWRHPGQPSRRSR